MQGFPAALSSLSGQQETAYLPDVRAFGFGGPRDDARHSQTGFAGVHEVCGVHLPSQRLDVLQDGDLDLNTRRSDIYWGRGGGGLFSLKGHDGF